MIKYVFLLVDPVFWIKEVGVSGIFCIFREDLVPCPYGIKLEVGFGPPITGRR